MLTLRAWPAWLLVATVGLLLGVRLCLLTAFLLAAVYSDLAERKIPNRVVLSGAAIAVLCQTVLPDGDGLWASVGGLGLGLALFLPLYLLRAMGAGDVKLMAMVGAYLGYGQILGAVLAVFVAGGVMALVETARRGALRRLLDNLKLMFLGSLFRLSVGQLPVPDTPVQSVGKLPYAVAIATGTLAYVAWHRYSGR